MKDSNNALVVEAHPGFVAPGNVGTLGTLRGKFLVCTEALAAIKPDRFDMVFSDFRMPVVTGGEFHGRAIQIDGRLQDPFFFVTGDTNNNEKSEFFRVTPVPFLRRPFKIIDLEKAISTVVRRQNKILGSRGTDGFRTHPPHQPERLMT